MLARSDFKVIYRGLNHETGCQISWHEVPLHHVSPDQLPKIRDNLEIISQLKHENLISWLDYWFKEDGKTMVFITELLPEGSLRQYLQKIGTPRVRVIRQWTRQILSGLKYLHSQPTPIFHGYLKPENLYVIPNTGIVKIGGLGKSVFVHNVQCACFASRMEYMAPELLRDKKVGGMDVYSLGMCLLEICTGTPPFDECQSPAAMFHRIIAGRKPLGLSRIVNEDIVDFIETCLKPLPERPSVAQLLQSEFLTGSPESQSSSVILRPRMECTDLEERQIDVEMQVVGAADLPAHKISFAFNLGADTPDSVAAEMVLELNLPQQQTVALSKQISERLFQFFFATTDCPTPSTRRGSVGDSMEQEDEEFMRERKLKATEDESLPQLQSSDSIHFPYSFSDVGSLPQMRSSALRVGGENNEEDVKVLQVMLTEKYSISLQTNGVFGKKTESLVKHFQEEVGHEVTGVVTAELWTALVESLKAKRDGQTYSDADRSSVSLI